MGLPRSPTPTTSAASADPAEVGGLQLSSCPPVPPVDNLTTTDAPSASQDTPSPEPDIVRSFRQEADRLHTAATILTDVTEDMLRDGFRQLIASKSAIDAANIAGSISKGAFLAAEKRFGQTRAAVLQKVKSLNPQVRNLTDLLRRDIAPRDASQGGPSERRSKRAHSSHRRSSSRSPHLPDLAPGIGFRPIHPQNRGGSLPTNLVYSVPPTSTVTSASANMAAPALPPMGSLDPAFLNGPYASLLLQGLLYQQQQAQHLVPGEPRRDQTGYSYGPQN